MLRIAREMQIVIGMRIATNMQINNITCYNIDDRRIFFIKHMLIIFATYIWLNMFS